MPNTPYLKLRDQFFIPGSQLKTEDSRIRGNDVLTRPKSSVLRVKSITLASSIKLAPLNSNTRNLISKLSLRRLLNICKVYLSFHLSRLTGKASHWGRPFSLAIEPATACNLRCPECPSGLRNFYKADRSFGKEFVSIRDQ